MSVWLLGALLGLMAAPSATTASTASGSLFDDGATTPLCEQAVLTKVGSLLTNNNQKKACQAALNVDEVLKVTDSATLKAMCANPTCLAALKELNQELPNCRYLDWAFKLSLQDQLTYCAVPLGGASDEASANSPKNITTTITVIGITTGNPSDEATPTPLNLSQSSSGSGSGPSLSLPPAREPSPPTSPQTTLSPSLTSSSPSAAAATESEGKSTSTLLVVGPIAATLVVLAVAIVLYRGCVGSKKRSKQTHSATSDSNDRAETPSTASLHEYQSAHVNPKDFRSDNEFVRFRIDRSEVKRGRQLARGGHGVVYRGSYDSREVAIKQMLPGAWRKDNAIVSFLDEIQFMGGGDLYSLLRENPEATQGHEWGDFWTPRNLRSKTHMAMDVAEAVVYLHSFSSPVIHRDLKAKNVLLDATGNAKLSDFGISREMAIDQTMTSEIGTVAWIAPEVLRGERYSEKADIFSLGVLLVEIDRCSHPYAKEPALRHHGLARTGGGNSSDVAGENARIAVLVSTGRLTPSISSACPADIAELVDWCLRFDATERPTAMEVFYRLRQAIGRSTARSA